jgi:ketosteroid isomerase-like protein
MDADVEVTRRGIEHFERGDLYEWLRMFHDEVLWFPVDMPDIESVQGKEAVLELMQSYLEPWDSVTFDSQVIEKCGDTVLWTSIQTVTQQSTGLTFSNPLAAVFDYRDHLCVRIRWYWDVDEARAAALATS